MASLSLKRPGGKSHKTHTFKFTYVMNFICLGMETNAKAWFKTSKSSEIISTLEIMEWMKHYFSYIILYMYCEHCIFFISLQRRRRQRLHRNDNGTPFFEIIVFFKLCRHGIVLVSQFFFSSVHFCMKYRIAVGRVI